jgi:hypothetical protein
MESKHFNKTLEDLDQRKVPVMLSYRLDSGKVVSITTLIRALVEKDGCCFVLTESGIPIPINTILAVKEKNDNNFFLDR